MWEQAGLLGYCSMLYRTAALWMCLASTHFIVQSYSFDLTTPFWVLVLKRNDPYLVSTPWVSTPLGTDRQFICAHTQINNSICKYVKSHQKPWTHELINHTRYNVLTWSYKRRSIQKLKCGRHTDSVTTWLIMSLVRKNCQSKDLGFSTCTPACKLFLLLVIHHQFKLTLEISCLCLP